MAIVVRTMAVTLVFLKCLNAAVIRRPLPSFERFHSPDAIPINLPPPFPAAGSRPFPQPPAEPRDGGIALHDDWVAVNLFNFQEHAYIQLMLPSAQLCRTWDKWLATYRGLLDGFADGWQWHVAQSEGVWRALQHRRAISATRSALSRYIDSHARLAYVLSLEAENYAYQSEGAGAAPAAGPPFTLRVAHIGAHTAGACDMLLGSHGECRYRSDTAGMLDVVFPRPHARPGFSGEGPSKRASGGVGSVGSPGAGMPYPQWAVHAILVEPNPRVQSLLLKAVEGVRSGRAGVGAWTIGGQPRNLGSEAELVLRARGRVTREETGGGGGGASSRDGTWPSNAPPFSYEILRSAVCEPPNVPTGPVAAPFHPTARQLLESGAETDPREALRREARSWRTGSAEMVQPDADVEREVNEAEWRSGIDGAAGLLNPYAGASNGRIPLGREIDPLTKHPLPGSEPRSMSVAGILRALQAAGEWTSSSLPPRGGWPEDMTIPVDLTPGVRQTDSARFAFGSVLRHMVYEPGALAVLAGTPVASTLASVRTSRFSANCTSVDGMGALVERDEIDRPRHGRGSVGPGAGRSADVAIVAADGVQAGIVRAYLARAHRLAAAAALLPLLEGALSPPEDVAQHMPFLLIVDGQAQPVLSRPGRGRDNVMPYIPGRDEEVRVGEDAADADISERADSEESRAAAAEGTLDGPMVTRLRREAGYTCRYIAGHTLACHLPVPGPSMPRAA